VGHARSGCALVLVLLAAGSGQGHAASTRTRLVYRMDVAGSVDPTVTAKTLAVLERRADDAFAGDARVTARGRRLVVDTGHNVSRGQASALAETGRLVFYDWEPNVIGPQGRPEPTNPNVTGGNAAGTAGAGTVDRPHADRRAAKRRPVRTIVLHAESKGDHWYVLDDKPALTGAAIEDPQVSKDPVTGAPIVVFDFTPAGVKAFHALSRRVARRGRRVHALQHYAVALDHRLVSVPYIDYHRSPDGIDASDGFAIEGSLTPASARRLAGLLKAGELPVALTLVSVSPDR
jgi:preprotein translocase subunit SecD